MLVWLVGVMLELLLCKCGVELLLYLLVGFVWCSVDVVEDECVV